MRALETSDPIELAVTATEPVTIRHGLGRQVRGWLLIWCSAPVEFFVAEPAADTRQELVLVPSATCDVRLLLI
jgi:hypothetical protein